MYFVLNTLSAFIASILYDYRYTSSNYLFLLYLIFNKTINIAVILFYFEFMASQHREQKNVHSLFSTRATSVVCMHTHINVHKTSNQTTYIIVAALSWLLKDCNKKKHVSMHT